MTLKDVVKEKYRDKNNIGIIPLGLHAHQLRHAKASHCVYAGLNVPTARPKCTALPVF